LKHYVSYSLATLLTIGHPLWINAIDALDQLRVERTRVNVRAKPSLKGRVLYQLSQGDVLKSLGLSGKWYEIEDTQGRRGYVYSDLVSRIEDPETTDTKRRSEEFRDIQALDDDTVRTIRPGPSRKTLLYGGGGAALIGVTALLLSSGDGDSQTTDADGDGFTPEQGDCDDTRSEVSPNGSVSSTADGSVTGQSVDCAADSIWRIFVANNSCDEVLVTSIHVDRAVLEQGGAVDCAILGPTRISPRQSIVPPGSAVVVYETNTASRCCDKQETCSGYCVFRSLYTVVTSAGALTAPPVRTKVEYGSQCPRCTSAIF
jgi:hypothetical protein